MKHEKPEAIFMKYLTGFWIIVGIALAPGLHKACAGTLSEDYKKMETRQNDLEKERKVYETQLRKLASRRHSLNLALNQCLSRKIDQNWGTKIKEAKAAQDKLEEKRNDLVMRRVELDNIRSDLESTRAEIENKYKNKRRGAEYEAEFRSYMTEFAAQYFQRVETELFQGYIAYLAAVEKYNAYLKKLVDECTAENKKN